MATVDDMVPPGESPAPYHEHIDDPRRRDFLNVAAVAFIGVGAFYVDPAHWHPFIPANTGGFGHFGYSGLLRGSAVVFFAFLGFDAACTAAQEARNPQRDMQVGILVAVAV